MYSAQILEDSRAPHGVRLTTMEVTFPRFILAEFNTHRAFSRNSASSRAIPTHRLLDQVRDNPFVPVFNERVTGMGVGDTLDDQERPRRAWLAARDHALRQAENLYDIGVDKSRANRLLEPFMWHTVIVTATDWDNFFALRCHEDAQPEIREIAEQMKYLLDTCKPREVNFGYWSHLPLVTDEEREKHASRNCALISASRCARVSYNRQHDDEDLERTLGRARLLEMSGHLSPFEHQANAVPYPKYHGNFYGWLQYRKTIKHEENFAAA